MLFLIKHKDLWGQVPILKVRKKLYDLNVWMESKFLINEVLLAIYQKNKK